MTILLMRILNIFLHSVDTREHVSMWRASHRHETKLNRVHGCSQLATYAQIPPLTIPNRYHSDEHELLHIKESIRVYKAWGGMLGRARRGNHKRIYPGSGTANPPYLPAEM